MSIQNIAADFTDLLKAGDFDGAAEKYWSDDVASIEPSHSGVPEFHGKAAAKAKNDDWARDNEVHRFETRGPYVNGDQFSVFMSLEVTNKPSGRRTAMDEVCLYTVRDGRVVEERFFY